MATTESPITAPAPGWGRPFPRDERVFLWLILVVSIAMTAFVFGWLIWGNQNVPTDTYRTTPKQYSAQVNRFVKEFQGADGAVWVPPGHDAYMLGTRFAWYPELVLQQGEKYKIWLSSADVLHGFSLVGGGQNLNLEVAPNHAYGAMLTPGKTGSFLLVCNEYCGIGHHHMKGRIRVVPASAMAAHVAAAPAKPATKPATGAGEGLALSVPGNELKFDKTALTATEGSVTVTLTNPSAIPHNIAIRGNGVDVKGDIVSSGGKSTVTADLKPGTYTFYCSIPGHEAAGMKGTLTVKPQ